MQTFLPYPSFARSAEVLDNKRLGKQRVEVLQILHSLTGRTSGWQYHPAVLMWEGYEHALCEYGIAVCEEWIYNRFFMDSCLAQIKRTQEILLDKREHLGMPPWLGDERLHASHQSNLVRKNPDHYSRLFPNIPPILAYYWPAPNRREG